MDAFIEKLVQKRRSTTDYLLSGGIILLSFIVAFVLFSLAGQFASQLGGIAMLLAVGAVYLGFRLQSRTNVEYEYLVTNDTLDVDKIISQRKRVRIFSAACREFETMAKVNSKNYGRHVTDNAQVIFAGTDMKSDDLYFVTLNYKGKKTVLYFEPDQRIVDSFKRFIPSKILMS